MNALPSNKPSHTMRKILLAGSIALVVAVSGCSSNKKSVSSSSHQGTSYATEEALQASVTYWGKRYRSNDRDPKTALNYGQSLRLLGRNEQALAVLEKLATEQPKDKVVLAAYGKALATMDASSRPCKFCRQRKLRPRRTGASIRRWEPFMTRPEISKRHALTMTKHFCKHQMPRAF